MFSKKITVLILFSSILTIALANNFDQTQLEKYSSNGKIKKYQLEVPGKEPITILETDRSTEDPPGWVNIPIDTDKDKDYVNVKDFMTDIIHDAQSQKSRCYGPSCQEGFDEHVGPHEDLEEYLAEYADPVKDYREYSKDRMQAMSELAEKLKYEKNKSDRYNSYNDDDNDEDNNGKVYTTWNRLKVKQHKHPYDDKNGWITLEPVAWSTSKISKWKPNIKKYKPQTQWNNDDDYNTNDDRYMTQQASTNTFKKPSMNRPTYINNKLHVSSQQMEITNPHWDSEMPSRPTWQKPSYSYPSSWKPDEGRRPQKPCDSDENSSSDDTVFYGLSDDSLVTDNRPTNFPYEYEALKRPLRRPTQVVYAGSFDRDSERGPRPPYGDGQWVLLSTTKGYRNKKRQRSLSHESSSEVPTIKSHQAVALTVLPVDNNHTNMTTSHGGLLEVERSFKTVEESKRDMDTKNTYDLIGAESAINQVKPTASRMVRRKIFSNATPDGSTVLAAVGAGMLPATMAMVVPMMLGRRKRDLSEQYNHLKYVNPFHVE